MTSRRDKDPKIDTGEQRAIDDAVERAVEKSTAQATQDAAQRAIMRDVAAEYHRVNCPAQGLGEKLDTFVGEFKEFRGEIRGQLRMVIVGVPLILTVCGMLVAGAWTLATRTAPTANHSAVASPDAGALVEGWGLIARAKAAE